MDDPDDPKYVPSSEKEDATASSKKPLSQAALSDLNRDPRLSKLDAELLSSRLKETGAVEPGVKSSVYRNERKNCRKQL